MNQKYYFTFGLDEKYPFQGGWVTVEAPTRKIATNVFMNTYPHPDTKNVVNCASIYTEEEFRKTEMYKTNDNFGHTCHKIITVTIDDVPKTNQEPEVVFIKKTINGKPITIGLTRQEAYIVYEQYEHLCDLDTIEAYFAPYENDEDTTISKAGVTAKMLRKYTSEIAYEMRRQMDKYDLDEYEAIEVAIATIIEENKLA